MSGDSNNSDAPKCSGKKFMSRCGGKKQLGKRIAQLIAAEHGCSAYECEYCKAWHTGSKRGPTIWDDDRPSRFQ